MSEGSGGGQDSRAGEAAGDPGRPTGDPHAWYKRGLDLLGRGSPAAAAEILQRAAAAEPRSRSVREALARAQFGARRYTDAADNFRMIVEASPVDDYAHFGLGLALARSGDPAAAAEYLALAAAMKPDSKHYTDALHAVRATLRARSRPRRPGPDASSETGSAGARACDTGSAGKRQAEAGGADAGPDDAPDGGAGPQARNGHRGDTDGTGAGG